MNSFNTKNSFKACILAGAIGDAMGSVYENNASNKAQEEGEIFHFFPKPSKKKTLQWKITDDTQLTLATCEAIAENKKVLAAEIAKKFNYYHQNRKLSGLGSSTLKALQALAMGAHWSQAGRRGEFAAGNGAAMRIAPLAFVMPNLDRRLIEDVCRITHYNTEAYAGALAVVLAIRAIIEGKWTGTENLFEILIPQIPDTNVRDCLIAMNQMPSNTSIEKVGKQFGASAYVVESIPLVIFVASKVPEIGLEKMFRNLIELGGDTDTNCSIAGQIAGAAIGIEQIPLSLLQKLKKLEDYQWIERVIENPTLTKLMTNC